MNIHIFGGGAGIGRWFVERGLSFAEKICVYDIDEKIKKDFNENKKVKVFHLDTVNAVDGDYLASSIWNLNSGDWIFLAVPIEQIEQLSLLLKRHIPINCCVAVMTSTQDNAIKIIESIGLQATVCGLHPLFGHTVPTCHGQTVAMCFEGKITPPVEKLKSALIKSGLMVTCLAPSLHDEYMSYVQGLTHFVMMGFFDVLSTSGHDLSELMKVKTPPFQFLSSFSSRLLLGTPSTYASIQATPAAALVREKLIKSITTLHQSFSDISAGETAIHAIRDPFTGGSLDELSQFSLAAVAAVQDRERYYYDFIDAGDIAVFKSRGTKEYKAGYIRKVDPTYVYVDEIITKVRIGDETYYPLPVNETAIAMYKQLGVSIRVQKNIKIKKGNIVVLARDRAKEWIHKNILRVTKSYTVHNPKEHPENYFEHWIPQLIPSVIKCEYIDSYKKRGEISRVQLRLSFVPHTPQSEIYRDIRAFCYGFTPRD